MKNRIKSYTGPLYKHPFFGVAGWIVGVAYVCLLTGLTLPAVGTVPESSTWTLWDSIFAFFVIAIPFALGLMAGSGREA